MKPVRRVVLGVTGSIAAYKAAELVRLLRKSGVEVHVILTRAGAEFITPLTMGTLSGNPVTSDMFTDATGGPYVHWGQTEGGVREAAEGAGESAISQSAMNAAGADRQGTTTSANSAARDPGIRHIQVSRESNLIIVAPASGNILGKVAHGIADDALSTAIMASSAPVLFAPAMNTRMWENLAVQENVEILRRRGYFFVQPGSGDLACGEIGAGRMADPHEVLAAALRLLAPRTGRKLLVTAGRTEEPIDPVRSLTNRSSGRMGFAIAEAARDFGYEVTLIAGLTAEEPPAGVAVERVRTAAEMAGAVHRLHGDHEVLVMAAAVADYTPREAAKEKIPSGRKGLTLELAPTADILASLRGKRSGKTTIGFALETGGDTARARKKLEAKGCDLMVMNNPLLPGSEFGGDTNQVTMLSADGRHEELPLMTKRAVALEILQRIDGLLRGAVGEDAETDAEPVGPESRAPRRARTAEPVGPIRGGSRTRKPRAGDSKRLRGRS